MGRHGIYRETATERQPELFWSFRPWPKETGPRGLTFPGQALRPQLRSGSLRGALAGDGRQQALGHLRVLGPRHKDLLQAVDKALQGAVPRGDSHGTYKTSQGQGRPDDGSDGNLKGPRFPLVWTGTRATSGCQEAEMREPPHRPV